MLINTGSVHADRAGREILSISWRTLFLPAARCDRTASSSLHNDIWFRSNR